MHTTNYINTFIEIAEDSPTISCEIPPKKGDNLSIANIQYEMIIKHPYKFDSDDVIFKCFALKNDFLDSELNHEKANFFSKGQPCLRASPLTKRYGWGIHYNGEGKIAIYGADTEDYNKFKNDSNLKLLKAMRSKKV